MDATDCPKDAAKETGVCVVGGTVLVNDIGVVGAKPSELVVLKPVAVVPKLEGAV